MIAVSNTSVTSVLNLRWSASFVCLKLHLRVAAAPPQTTSIACAHSQRHLRMRAGWSRTEARVSTKRRD